MQTATEAEPQLLTVRQVQALLHIDRSTIYRMASDGRLPAIRVGKQLRFPAREIDALVSGDRDPGFAVPTTPDGPDPAVATAAIAVASNLLGVMMVVTDMAGRPITPIVNACPGFEDLTRSDPTLAECLREWRSLAEDPDLSPRFAPGTLGFECARAFIRQGRELIGMVLIGGVAPEHGSAADGLTHLDASERATVLATLPVIARAIAGATDPNSIQTPTSPEIGA